MILNIVMLIKRSKHKYKKNSEKHIGTTIICDLPVSEPDQPPANNQTKPKKLFQYIKSIRTDNSGIASLSKGGT